MKGASGASLKLSGDFVIKTCEDATNQADWFRTVEEIGLPIGIRVPTIGKVSADSYEMEFIQGHLATQELSIFAIKKLASFCEWLESAPQKNATWNSYLERLESHVRTADTKPMIRALDLVSKADPFPQTFCHGDLTLENVIVDFQSCVLIDPNHKPGLYQSFILDLGKILQSTHFDYHRVFNSNPGVDLARQAMWIEGWLKERYFWDAAVVAAISHIIRLRKYRPTPEQSLVDSHLNAFINAYT